MENQQIMETLNSLFLMGTLTISMGQLTILMKQHPPVLSDKKNGAFQVSNGFGFREFPWFFGLRFLSITQIPWRFPYGSSHVPSGKLTQLWKITIEIVDFSIKHSDFP